MQISGFYFEKMWTHKVGGFPKKEGSKLSQNNKCPLDRPYNPTSCFFRWGMTFLMSHSCFICDRADRSIKNTVRRIKELKCSAWDESQKELCGTDSGKSCFMPAPSDSYMSIFGMTDNSQRVSINFTGFTWTKKGKRAGRMACSVWTHQL